MEYTYITHDDTKTLHRFPRQLTAALPRRYPLRQYITYGRIGCYHVAAVPGTV